MNSQIAGLRTAGVVFGLMAMAQLVRLLINPEVLVAGRPMQLWPSVLAFIFVGGLSVWILYQFLGKGGTGMRRDYGYISIVLILGLLMTGCTTIYKSAVDKRSVGKQYDDEKITMAIREKFMKDERIKYFDISTYCYNGHVYLVGEYNTEDQKNQAVKLAKEVTGVKSVTDYFLPKREDDTCGTTANLSLSAKVNAELIGDMDLSSTRIEVKALQCNIILLGLVGSAGEMQKAISDAQGVQGVRSVKSFLKVQK